VLARGATPRNPPLRSAPAWWYFAGSAGPGGDPPEPPAALRARVVVLRRHTGHSPGPRARFAGPVTSASPWPAVVLADIHRPLTGPKARFAGPVTSASP